MLRIISAAQIRKFFFKTVLDLKSRFSELNNFHIAV